MQFVDSVVVFICFFLSCFSPEFSGRSLLFLFFALLLIPISVAGSANLSRRENLLLIAGLFRELVWRRWSWMRSRMRPWRLVCIFPCTARAWALGLPSV